MLRGHRRDVASWPAGGDQTAEEQALARLADALSEPVFDVYHTFAATST